MSSLLQVRSQGWLPVGGVGVGALRPPFRLVSFRTGDRGMAKGKVPPDTFRLRGPSKLGLVENPEVGGSCYDAVDFAVGDQ